MKIAIIIASVLFVLFFLLFSRIRLRFSYRSAANIRISYLFLSFDLLKFIKKRSEKKKDRKIEDISKQNNDDIPAKKRDLRGFIAFIGHVTKVATEASLYFLSVLKIKIKEFSVTVSTDDASDTALLCGKVRTAANGLFAVLDRFSSVDFDRAEMFIAPDFVSGKSSVSFDAVFKIRVIYLLKLALRTYIKFFE